MTITEVLRKYFKEDNTLYYQSSDAHKSIEGDTYLRYQKNWQVELWFGGNNGEVCLLCTTNGDSLDKLITALIYG